MPISFQTASTQHTYVRMLITGPTGCGKTLTALKIAKGFGGACYVIDTERGSAQLYANHADVPKPYHVYNLTKYQPQAYIQCLDAVAETDANVCIIDSASHSWNGADGILDIAGGDIRGWKTATPEYHRLVNKMLAFNRRMHVIVTLRSKMDYILVPNPEKPGKTLVEKVGLAPIHREELPYEFDLVGAMTQAHVINFGGAGKSRFPILDNAEITYPGAELAETILTALKGA